MKQLEKNEKNNFETVFHFLTDGKLNIDTMYQKIDTSIINLFSLNGKYKKVFANRNEQFLNSDDIINSNIPKYQFFYSVQKSNTLILLFEEHYAFYITLINKNKHDKFVIEWYSRIGKECKKDIVSCLLKNDYELLHEQTIHTNRTKYGKQYYKW